MLSDQTRDTGSKPLGVTSPLFCTPARAWRSLIGSVLRITAVSMTLAGLASASNEGELMSQYFVAVKVPASVRKDLAQVQFETPSDEKSPDIRWSRPDQYHLTLLFIGPRPPGTLESLSRSLSAVAQSHGTFSLDLTGLGSFPFSERVDSSPRVLWAGVHGDVEDLHLLMKDLGKSLAIRQDFPLAPHVTLARARAPEDGSGFVACIESAHGKRFGTWAVRDFVLLESTGGEYLERGRFRLADSQAPPGPTAESPGKISQE